MTDSPSEDTSLKLVAHSGDEVDFIIDESDVYMAITDEDRVTSVYVSRDRATTLRDWLNKVLP